MCSFLPCRFFCSEIHSYLVNLNKHPSQPFTTYTLSLHSHSMPQPPLWRRHTGASIVCNLELRSRFREVKWFVSYFLYFFKDLFASLFQNHLGASSALWNPWPQFDGISRAGGSDRCQLDNPLGEVLQYVQVQEPPCKDMASFLQRPNLRLRMAALSPLSQAKVGKMGVITVIEQLLKKGHLTSAILGQVIHICMEWPLSFK